MGTITKRGELQWQAKVRRRGFPAQSRTFSYKEDAERWVRAMERELETTGFIDRREAERNTLADILLRYEQEVTPQKKSAAMEATKIKVLLKDAALTQIKTSALSSSIVAAWRDRRLKQVSGATVNREIDILSAAINHPSRAQDKARDGQRHPAETLAFFHVGPEMKVGEYSPGGGWYSRLLGHYLGGEGQLDQHEQPDRA